MNKSSVALLLSLTLFTGCRIKPENDTRPVVTVSILPLRYFAEQLGGDHFRINVLIPPGVSHHNYDPTPRQLQELEKSKALFVNGHLGFEKAWIPKLRSNYPRLAIIDLSAGINLISGENGEGGHVSGNGQADESGDHSHEGVDPHYWMSVNSARKFASTMADGLIQADPSSRGMVIKNLGTLAARLDSLEQLMNASLKGLSHRSFLIFHPALVYLARDYNLVQHSMELGGKEPTASHFMKLVTLSRIEKINTIFIQKEYDQENAQTLARETGSTIVVIDPMSPDWFSEMQQLADKLTGMDGR